MVNLPMTFVEVKERNLQYMKMIPGQYIITDKGRVFYDNDSGKRIQLSKSVDFIESRDVCETPDPDMLYLELKTGLIIRFDSVGSRWITVGGLTDAQILINRIFGMVKDLSQQVLQMRESHKCMKILTQGGDIRLAINMEYTMTVWSDTKIILPPVAEMESGHIRLWISINNGDVDYGTTHRMPGSLESLAQGTPGVVDYIWNPLKKFWVIDLKSMT